MTSNMNVATDGILLASFQLVEDMDKVPFLRNGCCCDVLKTQT